MKIRIVSITQDNNYQPFRGWDFAPYWKWTASNGTVYGYDKKGQIIPKPRTEIVHFDCPDPEDCGCDGWDSKCYYDPDTGEEIYPGRRMVTRYHHGQTNTTGDLEIFDTTMAEINKLVQPEHPERLASSCPVTPFSDPRVEQNSFTKKFDGGFLITGARVDSLLDKITAINPFYCSFVAVPSMEETGTSHE